MATRLSRLRDRRDQRGAVAVEFALILPIVVMLLFGTLSAGLVYSDHLAVTNAAREAARYGAAADESVAGWATSVRTRVQQVYYNSAGKAPTNNQICVKLVNSSGGTIASSIGSSCGTAPDISSLNMDAGSCAVLVWLSKPGTIELAVLPSLHPTVHASAVAYYGRTVGTTCTAK